MKSLIFYSLKKLDQASDYPIFWNTEAPFINMD